MDVEGDDPGPGRSEGGGLPAGGGAEVGDSITRSGTDQLGDPLGGAILDVAVVAFGGGRGDVHLFHRRPPFGVAELSAQTLDDPVRVTQPGGLVRPGHSADCDLAQDGVDEPAGFRGGERDGFGERCVRGDAGVVQLVGAEAEQGAGRRVRLTQDEPIDEEVACRGASGSLHRPAR